LTETTFPDASEGRIRRLITHDGRFHADEALAAAVLVRLFPEAEILRTRNAMLIAEAGPEAIVFDVGGTFDPGLGRFDHHQPGAPRRDDGAPLSAFGLVWAHFGRRHLRMAGVPEDLIEETAAAVDASLVRGIDLLDNGVLDPGALGAAAHLTLPALIEDLNPPFDAGTSSSEDAAFLGAVALAGGLLHARVRRIEADLRARREVLDRIRESGGDAILELERGAPFRSALAEAQADHVLFVVHPRKHDWVVSGVSRDLEGYVLRRDLPEAWAGLEGSALAEETGVADAVFCHRARFMAVAASREGALRLARRALDPEVAFGAAPEFA
jgi:uncharacterized UPF0160 family protein